MTINSFEGARRIMLLIGAVWGIGVVVVNLNDEPAVNLSYTVEWPSQLPTRVSQDECNPFIDAEDWRYIHTANGTLARIEFCFKTQKTDKGKELIPYRVDLKDQTWWGGEKYSSEVSEYIKRVSSEFQLSKADSEWADSQWWPTRWKQIREGAKWLLGGWFLLWLLTFMIGWIVRGFMGIPMGSDQRPASKLDD